MSLTEVRPAVQALPRREKFLLFQIEAVPAVQIANRPHGLGHDVKGRDGSGRVFVASLHRSRICEQQWFVKAPEFVSPFEL